MTKLVSWPKGCIWPSLCHGQKLHLAILRAFPKPGVWYTPQIQACTQKPDESVHDYRSKLQTVFWENSGHPIDIQSTRVAFNSMFVSDLNRDLSLSIKTTYTNLDFVNLVTQVAHILTDDSKRRLKF